MLQFNNTGVRSKAIVLESPHGTPALLGGHVLDPV